MKIKLNSNHAEEHQILASSPWVVSEGFLPHRIVLRLSGKIIEKTFGDRSYRNNEFVIHTEASVIDSETYFQQGDYTDSVRDAWAIFCERSNELMERVHKTRYTLADVEEEVANV
tara:strand:- start:1850 stop:2194 length:345 start_codon:yes stop_codon:yes gene_type:complete